MKQVKLIAYIIAAIFFNMNTISAQSGVYLNFADFQNGKLIKADGDKITVVPGHGKIVMTSEGEKKEYNCESVFGMLVKGALFRFPKNSGGMVYKLVKAGDFCVWNWISNLSSYNGVGATATRDQRYAISKGVDGDMLDISMPGRLAKNAKEHKELQPMVDCLKGKKGGFYEMMSIYDCISHEPGYKENPEDIIPAIK